jgi:hypothetical protein
MVPPPGVGGDTFTKGAGVNASTAGAPAATGSVCPVDDAREVEPIGVDNPQLIAGGCANAALAMINIMPVTSTGINSRLKVICILSFLIRFFFIWNSPHSPKCGPNLVAAAHQKDSAEHANTMGS